MTAKTKEIVAVSTLAACIAIFFAIDLSLGSAVMERPSEPEFVLVIPSIRHAAINLQSCISNPIQTLTMRGALSSFFPTKLFGTSYRKTRWIDNVNAIYQAYRRHFSMIYLEYNIPKKEYDVIFVLAKNNRRFHFANGAMLPDEVYDRKKHFVPYYYAYPTDDCVMVTHYPFVFTARLYAMDRNYELFYDLYGRSPKTINDQLEFIRFGRFSFPMNTGTECYEATKAVFKEFEELRHSTPKLERWFNSIKSISSFSHRTIANTGRPSTHTFSIAMDILTRDNRPNYWYWTSKFRKKWWTVPMEERAFVPDEVVRIFEKHGFCWGGKWERYDMMHFEYKPENLLRMIR
jgi:hypothetical protein